MHDLILHIASLVSLILVATYGVTTSTLLSPLRMTIGAKYRIGFLRMNLWMLLSCPLCSGFWITVCVVRFMAPDFSLATIPLFYLAIPISQRLLPAFITGPADSETTYVMSRQQHGAR